MDRALTHQDWEAAVKLVQLLGAACSSTAQPPAAVGAELQRRWRSIQAAFEDKQMLPMSAATWQRLIESRVPHRLASACCRVLQHCSPAPSPSPSPAHQQQQRATQQPLAAAAYSLVLRLLDLLVGKANCDRQLTARGDTSLASFWQQLQESGLLQLPPSILSHVAAQLHAATRVPPAFSDSLAAVMNSQITSFAGLDFAATTRSTGPAPLPLAGSSSSPSPSTSTGRQQRGGIVGSSSSSSTDTISVLQTAAAVVDISRCVTKVDPAGRLAPETPTDFGPAALRAAAAVPPFISHCMQHAAVQHSYGLQDQLVCLWGSTEQLALAAMTSLAAASKKAGQGQEAARMLEVAYADVLPCFAAVSCTLAYRQLLLQLPALPGACHAAGGGSSSSSSSSTGSSSNTSSSSSIARLLPQNNNTRSRRLCYAQTWQLASQQCGNMPQTHVQLAQLLGCDMKVLLWLAASYVVLEAAIYSGPSQCEQALAAVHGRFLDACDADSTLARHGAGSAWLEQRQPDEQCRLLQLHYLLPSVLLYYAAHQPAASSLGSMWVAAGRSLAVQCSAHASNALQRSLHLLALSQPAGSTQRQPVVSVAAHQAMLRELFLHASHIAPELLPQLASGAAADSTARSAFASSSTAAASSVQPPAAVLGSTVAAAAYLLCVLCDNSSSSERWRLTGATPTEQAGMKSAADIGLQHAIWLTHLLEATVRHLSEAGNPFSSLDAICWGFVGEGGFLRSAALAAGPDSPQQAQLISLCCSVLKALACSCNSSTVSMDLNLCCLAVTRAAAYLFVTATTQPSEESVGLEHPVGAAGAWLAVLGRCFLFTAAAVQQLSGAAVASSTGASSACDLFILLSVCADVTTKLQDWLQQDGVAAQLSAAGFDAAGLLQCALDCPAEQMRSLEGFHAAQQQVQSLAAALTSLPLSQACNNTSCGNLSGPRELQLVNGRSCLCAGCKQARYCSRACQVQSWVQHKPVCKAMAAAAAAASASTAASAAGAEAQG